MVVDDGSGIEGADDVKLGRPAELWFHVPLGIWTARSGLDRSQVWNAGDRRERGSGVRDLGGIGDAEWPISKYIDGT